MARDRTTKTTGSPPSPSGSAPPDLGRSFTFRWRYALLIFLLALTLRGFYLFEASRQPDFYVFYMDEEYNLEWARSLASGVWNAPYDQIRTAP
ncbi:MAG: hypothetical protein JSW03_06765 [Candidatus Eiseniibacteriota bacterium]|nr:MAG: hypothetical protein JSW03_06765 [Candidatus Eisenbacteria bacterium]